MPDGMGGASIGAGGATAAAIVAYVLDKAFGSGRSLKSIDDKFADLKKWLDDDIEHLTKLAENTSRHVERVFDMHNVVDPEDPSGYIWYFSVGLRGSIRSLSERVSNMVGLLSKVVDRFDQYNKTLEKLIAIVEKLQADVSALGVIISTTSR